MEKKYVLGIDIGGTNSKYGIVDREGRMLFDESVPTKAFETAQDLVDHIHADLNDKKLLFPYKGIGIGAPNGNYFSGTIEFAPNLAWKGIIPLADLFSKKFGVPAILTNDANAAAIGEMIYGNARDLKDFVSITLGTGLGSGVVINGQMVYGHDGFAGEYGHIRVIPNGRNCGCGRQGCLETYASATGMIRSISELPSENAEKSALKTLAEPDTEHIFSLAESGDLFAKEIVDFTAKVLGNALADYACFSSPKAYVLFGGVSRAGKNFADLVKKHMEENILNIYRNKIEIKISALNDKNAAVLGASSLVWNEIN